MEIEFFMPQGPQPTEMVGLAELRRALPPNWKAFANFVMRQPGRRGQDREIDVAIVAQDRVILVDLKHVRGRVENRGGFWYRGESRLYASPAHKIRDNAKVLASLMKDDLRQLRSVPPVESVVVLTAPTSDPSGLTQVERERTFRLADFVRISDPSFFRNVFTLPTKFGAANALCGGGTLPMLQRFFRNNRMFEPRRAKYQGFVPTGHPEFKHRLFSELSCHEETNPNYTGLLRLWDFSVEDEFLVEESRRPVAERERMVLGHIRMQSPEFYDNYVLRSIAHDAEFTLRYSEIFDRQPDLERLTRFAPSSADLQIARRLEIARLFLDRVATLHRLRVAHRDLDRHSVWIDDARSKVVLSGFGAAHFPARTSIGAARSKLLAGGVRVPEDEGRSKPGTPFQHDVFLAGVVVWNLLTGDRLPLDGNVPKWAAGSIEATDVPPQYEEWFDRCLAADPRDRFADGVEAADAFGEHIRKAEKVSLERQLERYRQDVDPMSDYTPTEWKRRKPHRVFRSGEGDAAVFVKSWPERSLGEPRKSAVRLIEFFGRAEALKASPNWAPKIDLACLCTDGLLLVQEWIDGASLGESDTGAWSPEQRRDFIGGLIRAVDGLHSFGLAHGDLSPANIMLRKGVSAFRPVLVDVVDFSLEEGGKSTPAYCPVSDHDLRMRDRFAVCAIAKEIVVGAADQEASLIALGADRCGEGDTPWLTLKPLADALIPVKAAIEPLNIAVELRRVTAEGEMLGDNGVFHIVRSKGRDNVIEVVGFDQKLTIEFDPGDSKPKFGRVDRVSPATLDWARGYALFSLNANIDLRRSSNTSKFAGVDKLIRMVLEASPQSSPSSAATAEQPAETAGEPAEPKQFPVARFWKETIAVEEAARPEIRLVSDPRWDDSERTLSFECDKGIKDVMPLEGQSVVLTWNGSRIGDVDAGRCRGAAVTVRNARNWKELVSGDVLRLQSNDDLISFNRRSRAVGRILEGRAEIDDLIMYFDPQTDLLPRRVAADVDNTDLDGYELNDDQKCAFKHLWTNGPLGLLQGPPGTGKTRFIGAFAHYALTKGGLRNVLLLSQSNEAVNTAAERVLNISPKLTGSIDMLRVGYSEKTSPKLLPYQSRAIQDRYRELFRANLKERVAYPSRRLGLGREYVAEALENEAFLGSLARQIELAEIDLASHPDGDVKAAARERLQNLNRAWLDLLEENSIAPGIGTLDTLEITRDGIAARHSVVDADARRRLLRLEALGREWVSALATRSRDIEELLAKSRNLICGTCVGIGRRNIQIERSVFDLVIIDEAARCAPGELAVGMQSAKRVLLVGDHAQLPPLFDYKGLREVAARLGYKSRIELAKSDFERAFDSKYGIAIQQVLERQYRMAPKIADLVARLFYPGRELKNERGVPPDYYEKLPRPLDDELTWIDTGYSQRSGRELAVETSYMNRREGAAILELLRKLSVSKEFLSGVDADPNVEDDEPLVGVICMYAPQVDHISDLILQSNLPDDFKTRVKVGTVDSYQGKENAIVIVSLVRSNPDNDMGHVRVRNRVNVALSRAKERLIIVGSAQMFEKRANPLREAVNELRRKGRVFTDGLAKNGGGRGRAQHNS